MADPLSNKPQTFSTQRRELLTRMLAKKGIQLDPPSAIPSRPQTETCPLSFAQQRLWFLDRLGTGAAYNMYLAVRLRGSLDTSALSRSFEAMIHRHEVLRTSFPIVEENPVQAVAPAQPYSLPVVTIEHEDPAERELQTRQMALDEARRPFDLAVGPLFRARLVQLAEQDHVLMLSMHHVISDGWSIGIFMRELAEFHAAFCENRNPALPELPIQYADFSHWQRAWLAQDTQTKQLDYWRKQLDGISTLRLATDHPRPAMQTFRGARASRSFSRSLTERIDALCQQESITSFMLLLAAFQVLLHRHSGQDDIVVGTPIANRNRTELEGLIGFFVNSLALRSDCSGAPSFRTFSRRVRDVVLGAFAHQDVPFEELVKELHPDRDASRHPFFQIMIAVHAEPLPPLRLAGVEAEPWERGSISARFDLEVDLHKGPVGLECSFLYSRDLFEPATIERMLGHFELLLEGIVTNPDTRIGDLPILTEEERTLSLVAWNDHQAEFPEDLCIHQLIEQRADRDPDALAITSGGRRISYGELEAHSNQLAHHLIELGIGPETIVGLCMERSADMVLGLMGILKAGAAYMPLDPEYPKGRLAFMLEDARAPVLLSQVSLRDSIPQHAARVIYLDSEWGTIGVESEQRPRVEISPQNLAYLIYTSGSTGKPKGVSIPHRSLCNLVAWHNRVFELKRTDRTSQLAAMAFDAAGWEIWPTLAVGASLHIAPNECRTSPEHLRDWLVAERIDIGFVPTPLAEQLLTLGWPRDVALRTLLTGGDKLHRAPPPSLPFELVNNYGPSENAVVTTSGPVSPGRDAEVAPSIGRPIANNQIYLLDSQLMPVPIGTPGELCIGGDSLARGYHERPELTAERFIPSPLGDERGARLYRTGDLARHLPDGRIEFLGRIDSQVKLRGVRIELGEIEAALCEHARVAEAVTLVREDIPRNQRLVAYVVAQGAPPTLSELRSFARLKLPESMLPSALVVLDRLPTSPNGKIDHNALPAPDHTPLEQSQSFEAPHTETERIIAEIWSQLLDVKEVGIHDNFFDLGGHSLLFMHVVHRLEEKLDLKLEPRDLLFRSLEQIAASCDAKAKPHEARIQSTERRTHTRVEPLFFGSVSKPLFGCHHPAAPGSTRKSAIVLCSPMGEEYIRFHRAFRHLADDLAAAGFPVLRFDFYGCGDSGGEAVEADLDQWLRDVVTAIDESKRKIGVEEVCLVGFRLGATLAMLAASPREDVAGLVLLDPVVDGTSYLEELRGWHDAMLRHSNVMRGVADPAGEGEMEEILGFAYPRTLIASLEHFNLAARDASFARNMLLIETHEERDPFGFPARSRPSSPNFEYKHLPHPELWERTDRFQIEDVNRVQIPRQLLRSVVTWTSERCA